MTAYNSQKGRDAMSQREVQSGCVVGASIVAVGIVLVLVLLGWM